MKTTVNDVIQTILKEIPGAPFDDTVDTLKSGSLDQPVTGVVTTFIATLDVLRQAVDLGANFIITHEPTYYNHRDQVDWLAGDPVYEAKQKFIQEHGLAIWRFHDYWHSYQPDGIYVGLVKLLGWEDYQDTEKTIIFNIPPTSLTQLTAFLKEKLGISQARVVGPEEMTVRRVSFVVGALPGEFHIQSMGKDGADVVVCGEVSEWQMYEYVRDANLAGMPKALIVAGHERTEEPGMAYLVDWLTERMPGLKVTHISAHDPLTIR